MTDSVTVAAPAKINLQLGVGPRRPDGFHTLATVYQAIGLYDDVTVARADATTLTVSSDGVDASDVPTDASNLALRAVALLSDHAGLSPDEARVRVHVHKRIPTAGGMAGGSADAAAALLACDALWGLGIRHEELLDLAASLGSDVPFSLVGGTAVGTGRGEVVEPVDDSGTYWWVVALSTQGLPTPAVFAEFDRLNSDRVVPEPALSGALLEALATGDPGDVAQALSNDLTGAALSLRPDLRDVLDLGSRAPALAGLLSGSGPTCLFLTRDEPAAHQVATVLDAAGTTVLVAGGPAPGAHVVTAL